MGVAGPAIQAVRDPLGVSWPPRRLEECSAECCCERRPRAVAFREGLLHGESGAWISGDAGACHASHRIDRRCHSRHETQPCSQRLLRRKNHASSRIRAQSPARRGNQSASRRAASSRRSQRSSTDSCSSRWECPVASSLPVEQLSEIEPAIDEDRFDRFPDHRRDPNGSGMRRSPCHPVGQERCRPSCRPGGSSQRVSRAFSWSVSGRWTARLVYGGACGEIGVVTRVFEHEQVRLVAGRAARSEESDVGCSRVSNIARTSARC